MTKEKKNDDLIVNFICYKRDLIPLKYNSNESLMFIFSKLKKKINNLAYIFQENTSS